MQTSENPRLKVMHALPRDHHGATRILAFLYVHMHACVYFCFSINGLHLGMRSRQGQGSMAGHQGVLPCPVHCGAALEKSGEQNTTESQNF